MDLPHEIISYSVYTHGNELNLQEFKKGEFFSQILFLLKSL